MSGLGRYIVDAVVLELRNPIQAARTCGRGTNRARRLPRLLTSRLSAGRAQQRTAVDH